MITNEVSTSDIKCLYRFLSVISFLISFIVFVMVTLFYVYFYKTKYDYFRCVLFTAVISCNFSSQSGAVKLAKVGYEGAIGHHCFNSIFIPENDSF